MPVPLRITLRLASVPAATVSQSKKHGAACTAPTPVPAPVPAPARKAKAAMTASVMVSAAVAVPATVPVLAGAQCSLATTEVHQLPVRRSQKKRLQVPTVGVSSSN